MNQTMEAMFLLGGISMLSACSTAPTATPSEGPRTIVVNGNQYDEEKLGKFNSWACRDFIHEGRTLVEVGTFSNENLRAFGFVLYDGGDEGDFTNYQRKGINHRWDWGPNSNDYAFVIKPDGTGLFYDFSLVRPGTPAEAKDIYKCSRH